MAMHSERAQADSTSGEHTLLQTRPHAVTVLLRSALAILILIAYISFIKQFTARASGPRIADLVLWLAVVVVAARLAIETARWRGRRYVLTDRRLWAWDGVFRRWRVEVTLDRVQNIVLHRTLLERLLGLGTIGVSSAAGGAGLDVLWLSIPSPQDALEHISKARDAALTATKPGNSPKPAAGPVAPPTPSAQALGRATPARPLVIGLVGGIGSGKSAVAAALAALGAVVSDSDTQAKAMLDREEIRQTLVGWWGDRVRTPGGLIDRRAVASIVFTDPDQRRRLEQLIHPLLREGREALKRDAAARGAPLVVIDAPLLYEAGVDVECDEVWFIDTPRPLRLARIAPSRGWDEAELDRREAAQMPLEEKRRRATRVIPNDADLQTLQTRVREAAHAALAGRREPRDA